jgi:hypothetical protein
MGEVMITCEYCKEKIENDIAHINSGMIFHLSCYREYIHGPDDHPYILYECPRCHTLGSRWNGEKEGWRLCALCKGAGYLSIE